MATRGDDRIVGYTGIDTLYGDAGKDRIEGYGDDDTIYGGTGERPADRRRRQ